MCGKTGGKKMFPLARCCSLSQRRVTQSLLLKRQYSKLMEKQREEIMSILTPSDIRRELKDRQISARGTPVAPRGQQYLGLVADLKFRLLEAVEGEHRDLSPEYKASMVERAESDYDKAARSIRQKFDQRVTSKMIGWTPAESNELTELLKDIENPRKRQSWISDNGQLLSESEHIMIDSFIESMFENIGVEVAVITIKDIPPSLQSGLELATLICQHWQIGYYSAGKGLVIVAVDSARSISVVPTKGIQSYFDSEFTTYINSAKPKEVTWSTALSHVVRVCEEKLEDTYKKEPYKHPPIRPSWLILLLIAGFLAAAFQLYQKKQNQTHCEKCGERAVVTQTAPIDLNSGEECERQLDSARHYTKVCTNPECNETEKHRLSSNKFLPCGICGYYTKRKTHPNEDCIHCALIVMSIGIPIKLLHEAEGHIISIELKSGEVYRGKLEEAEDNMNCTMTNITMTSRDGSTQPLDSAFIRGSHIKFLILPDMLKNAPMFRKDLDRPGKLKGTTIAAARGGRGGGRGGGPGAKRGRGAGAANIYQQRH